MRKKFVQIAALMLVFCLLPLTSVQASGRNEQIIRVGLAYGTGALEGANLLNKDGAGSGYRFGYFDSNDQFVQLGSTNSTAVSVVKTTNVGYNSSVKYVNYSSSYVNSSSVVVGCYHVQLPGGYTGFEEAKAAAALYSDGFVAYIDGSYYVRVGNYTTESAAQTKLSALGIPGAEVLGTSSYGVSVVITGTNTILFQYDDKGSGTGLGIMPNAVDSGADYVTWFYGNSYYGGFRFERIKGGNLTVVNVVGLEDYVKGVIPYEMSASWPLEALKAQAVCARSYVMRNLNKHNGSYHFDICTTTECQVYQGTERANSNSDRAVNETAGEYVLYNGQIIDAVFYASNGGATEDSENVWSGALPYLRGKPDPYEALNESNIPGYRWSYTYTGKELQTYLNNKGFQCSEIVDVQITYTANGNVYSITFIGKNGDKNTFSKEKARTNLSGLGVRSMRYTVTVGGSGGGSYSVAGGGTLSDIGSAYVIDGNGNVSTVGSGPIYAITGSGTQTVTASGSGGSSTAAGSFTITGAGYGHNVGLSQEGARAMAKEGYTYKQILQFYYTGVTIGTR